MNLLAGLIPPTFPGISPEGLDLSLLAFTLGLSMAAGFVFSIVPAVQAARASLHDALQQGGRSAVGGGRAITRDALVVAQVAAALVLLVAAGLMVRTLMNWAPPILDFVPIVC